MFFILVSNELSLRIASVSLISCWSDRERKLNPVLDVSRWLHTNRVRLVLVQGMFRLLCIRVVSCQYVTFCNWIVSLIVACYVSEDRQLGDTVMV